MTSSFQKAFRMQLRPGLSETDPNQQGIFRVPAFSFCCCCCDCMARVDKISHCFLCQQNLVHLPPKSMMKQSVGNSGVLLYSLSVERYELPLFVESTQALKALFCFRLLFDFVFLSSCSHTQFNPACHWCRLVQLTLINVQFAPHSPCPTPVTMYLVPHQPHQSDNGLVPCPTLVLYRIDPASHQSLQAQCSTPVTVHLVPHQPHLSQNSLVPYPTRVLWPD